jgi:hypothetical protein
MSQNNITSISQFQQKSTDAAVTLDSVKAAINAWRETKKSASEKMPTILWDKILALLETAPESKTLAALNVTRPQLEAERRRRQSQSGLSTKDDSTAHVEPIDFCEVKQRKPEPSTGGLVYKPAESFSTTTSVVEVYRPDGMLMKIHICTERFSELLSAFFKA